MSEPRVLVISHGHPDFSVPSIWWENSPLVIQEAFAAGRPVLCSNIGGMAEKVIDGVNGLHFRVNSAADLAARIELCVNQPELWQKLRQGVPKPLAIEEAVDKLMTLYERNAGSLPPMDELAVHDARREL